MPDRPALPKLPFTSAQALDAGLSRKQLRGPAVRRLHHNLYVGADADDTLALRVRAARRVLPADAVVTGCTALQILGVDTGGGSLSFATTWRHPVRRPGIKVSRLKHLPPSDRGCVLPAYAFVGAAAELDLLRLVQAGDQLVKWRHATVEELVAAAADTRGRGSVGARRAAALVRERVDSPRETRVRLLLVLAGLPEPELNMPTNTVDGAFLGRPDLRWRAYRTTLEYEGDQHRSDKQQWDYDIARYEAFAAAGWTVVRVTAQGLRQPRALVRRVLRVLRDGGYRGPDPRFTAEWVDLFE